MRFLAVTRGRQAPPPEMALQLVDAMEGWLDQHASKTEQTWGFAGIQGGGGILNVASMEELDAVMADFPLGPFSDIEIYGLVELKPALQRNRQAMQAMAPKG